MNRIILIAAIFASIAATAQTFTLKSNELYGQATSKQVLNGFGCNGENKSPQLFWENPPEGTKSFAVTVFDEDAPTGSGWWHWLIFDIPASVKELKSDAGNLKGNVQPKNVTQSKTDFGTPGFSGFCPTPGSGFHRYVVTVYALDVEKLGLDENANPALVGFYLSQHLKEKASLIAYLKKQ